MSTGKENTMCHLHLNQRSAFTSSSDALAFVAAGVTLEILA